MSSPSSSTAEVDVARNTREGILQHLCARRDMLEAQLKEKIALEELPGSTSNSQIVQLPEEVTKKDSSSGEPSESVSPTHASQYTFAPSFSSMPDQSDLLSSSLSISQHAPGAFSNHMNVNTNRTRLRQGVFAVIRAGSCVTLQSLLQTGRCRANERDYQNCTPLHIAAHEGREDMAVILLAYGADVFAIDDRNRTPRDVAVSNRHSGLGRFLLLEMKEAALRQPPIATTIQQQDNQEDEGVLSPPPTMQRGGQSTIPVLEETTGQNSHFRRRRRTSTSAPTPMRSLLTLDPSEQGRERLLAKIVAEADLEEAAAQLEKSARQKREQEEEDEKVRLDKEEEEAALRHQNPTHHLRTLTPDNASMFATSRSDLSAPMVGFVSATCTSCKPGWRQLSSLSPTLGFSLSPSKHDVQPNSTVSDRLDATEHSVPSGQMPPPCICPSCFSHHVVPPELLAQRNAATNSASTSAHIRNTSTNSEDADTATNMRPRTTSMIGSQMVTYPPLPLSHGAPATYLKYYQNSVFRTITDEQSLIICLVGLPGRGKSFISKRVSRYLNWKGIPCRIFNAGDYRRRILGAEGTAGADFFDPTNEKAKEARDQMAHLAVEDMLKFISRNPVPSVGILDATNTTVSRRQLLLDSFRSHFGLVSEEGDNNSGGNSPKAPLARMEKARVIFIESVCNVQDIITENILRAKFGNDDFKGVQDPQAVVDEFRDRIKQYEKVYETINEEEDDGRISFIKIVDVKQRVILHHVRRGLASKVSYFLMNLHPMAFPVFIVVPGETAGSAAGKFGGDENLTATGKEFARKMRRFIKERVVVMQEAKNQSKFNPIGAPESHKHHHAKGASGMGLRILCATNPSAQETLRIATRTVAPKTKIIWNSVESQSPLHQTVTIGATSASTVSSDSTSEEDTMRESVSSSLDSLDCADNDNVDAAPPRTNLAAPKTKAVETPTPRHLNSKPSRSDLIQGVAVKSLRALDDLNYGLVSNMSEGQICDKYPKLSNQLFVEVDRRDSKDEPSSPTPHQTTLNYAVSFPRGESCRMCNVRLEGALFEIMRSNGPVMVIAPRVPSQGVLAFLTDVLPERSPQLDLPKHTIIEITTKGQVVYHTLL